MTQWLSKEKQNWSKNTTSTRHIVGTHFGVYYNLPPPPSTTRFNCLQCTLQVESLCFVECLYDQWKSFAVNYKFVPPFQIQFLGVQYVNKLKFKLTPSDNSLKNFMKNHLCNLKLFFMPSSKCRRLVVLLCMNFISCIIILYENPQNRLYVEIL